MIRTLLLGAVSLDEMPLYNGERHASTDSGVFDEGQVNYDNNGHIVQNEILIKPGVEVYGIVNEEENELVYGQNGEITEVEKNNNLIANKDEEDLYDEEEEVEIEDDDELEETDRDLIENEQDSVDGPDSHEENSTGDEEEENESDSAISEEEQERSTLNIDAKETIRSELQELLAAEEEAMVKLSKEVELSVLEERRLAEKLNGEKVIRDCEENEHQVPNPTDGYLGINENGDVVLTTGSDREMDVPTPEGSMSPAESDAEQNGHAEAEEENEIIEEKSTEEVTEKDQQMEVEGNAEESPATNGETEQVEEVEDKEEEVVEPEVESKPRRSTRTKKTKAKPFNPDLFVDMNLKTSLLEGHHHDVCSVDMHGKFIVSAGRDTSLKLWDSSTQTELHSLGGHESTITKVLFLRDQPFKKIPPVLSASTDCSLRLWNLDEGQMTKSIYIYNTISCMDYSSGQALIGTDGGKVEVYNVESGEQTFTINAYDGTSVTAVKFLDSNKIVCGSTTGIIKIYDTTIEKSDDLASAAIFTLDSETVTVNSKSESKTEDQPSHGLNMSKINCMVVYDNLVIYGDNGYNIKVLDYEKGSLTKVRNNLKEFCPTEALYIGEFQSTQYLFSVGSDVDNGDAYINIRSLPELHYLGTIRDNETNSGSVTSFCQQEIDKKLHFVTGGQQLRVWNQVVRRGRKRKNSPNGDLSYVPCKYICNLNDPRDSEPESDNETETETESKTESSTEQTVERVPAGNSWCTIL